MTNGVFYMCIAGVVLAWWVLGGAMVLGAMIGEVVRKQNPELDDIEVGEQARLRYIALNDDFGLVKLWFLWPWFWIVTRKVCNELEDKG